MSMLNDARIEKWLTTLQNKQNLEDYLELSMAAFVSPYFIVSSVYLS